MKIRLTLYIALLTMPAAADGITVRINEPVKPIEAIAVAKRLGQITFAVKHCGAKPKMTIVEVLLRKQMEGGAGGNMDAAIDALADQARTFGLKPVCGSLNAMFGKGGSVIDGALQIELR